FLTFPAQFFLLGSHGSASSTNLAFNSSHLRKLHISTSRRPLTVQASYSDGERSSSANAFVGGFVLGGLVVGALGCVFAPQVILPLQIAVEIILNYLLALLYVYLLF
ncbi:hypothetical protein Godav_019273, partial [Gossypium davidsonii]|nr:hypothetical protein [Gossypium davidsonii]